MDTIGMSDRAEYANPRVDSMLEGLKQSLARCPAEDKIMLCLEQGTLVVSSHELFSRVIEEFSNLLRGYDFIDSSSCEGGDIAIGELVVVAMRISNMLDDTVNLRSSETINTLESALNKVSTHYETKIHDGECSIDEIDTEEATALVAGTLLYDMLHMVAVRSRNQSIKGKPIMIQERNASARVPLRDLAIKYFSLTDEREVSYAYANLYLLKEGDNVYRLVTQRDYEVLALSHKEYTAHYDMACRLLNGTALYGVDCKHDLARLLMGLEGEISSLDALRYMHDILRLLLDGKRMGRTDLSRQRDATIEISTILGQQSALTMQETGESGGERNILIGIINRKRDGEYEDYAYALIFHGNKWYYAMLPDRIIREDSAEGELVIEDRVILDSLMRVLRGEEAFSGLDVTL